MNIEYLRHNEVQKFIENKANDVKMHSFEFHTEDDYSQLIVWFYLERDGLLEVFEYYSEPTTPIKFNGTYYESSCNLRLMVGMKKIGNYTIYEEFFKNMIENGNEVPSIRDINKKLGVDEEELNKLLETFDEEYESSIKKLKKISLEKLEEINSAYS